MENKKKEARTIRNESKSIDSMLIYITQSLSLNTYSLHLFLAVQTGEKSSRRGARVSRKTMERVLHITYTYPYLLFGHLSPAHFMGRHKANYS